ncbi:DUF4129 domain-containing protein [Kitasatospora sp. NPDC052896]|uniref:DUF4129 domain-containing protein n=1 Tax=Kitasatospora sp. NPDC052896 TaxID=3364061 RepID=UPI0037C57250
MTQSQQPAGRPAAGPIPADPVPAERLPDRRWLPALVTLLGLLLAALVLRPTGRLLTSSAHPPIGSFGLDLLLGVGWLVLAGRFAARYRDEVRHLDGPTPRAERLRAAARLLLPAGAVLVPLLMAVSNHQSGTDKPVTNVPIPELPMGGDSQPGPGPDGPPHRTSTHWLAVLAELLVYLVEFALLVGVVVGAVLAVRYLRSLDRPAPGGPVIVRTDPDEALAEAVESGRRALRGSDARAAVIACYAAMEESLGRSGIARRIADSPTDLLERAVTGGAVGAAETRTLTGLFREARYSSHPMDEGHVAAARVALDAIAATLAERVAEQTSGPATAVAR